MGDFTTINAISVPERRLEDAPHEPFDEASAIGPGCTEHVRVRKSLPRRTSHGQPVALAREFQTYPSEAVMEFLLVLSGGLVALVASVGTEVVRQRGRRDELRDDALRTVYGDFAGAATKARYEYERRAQLLTAGTESWMESEAFVAADNELAEAFHMLSIIGEDATAKAARNLREHLETMKHWQPADADDPASNNLGPNYGFHQLVMEAWRIRDAFVLRARTDLGLSQERQP